MFSFCSDLAFDILSKAILSPDLNHWEVCIDIYLHLYYHHAICLVYIFIECGINVRHWEVCIDIYLHLYSVYYHHVMIYLYTYSLNVVLMYVTGRYIPSFILPPCHDLSVLYTYSLNVVLMYVTGRYVLIYTFIYTVYTTTMS